MPFRLQTFMVEMSWMTRMLFRISTNALTFSSHVTRMTTESIKFNEFQFIIILISISQKARERIHKNAFRNEWVFRLLWILYNSVKYFHYIYFNFCVYVFLWHINYYFSSRPEWLGVVCRLSQLFAGIFSSLLNFTKQAFDRTFWNIFLCKIM